MLTMKLTSKIIFVLGVCSFLMLYSGCNKKHPAPPSITDQQIDLLGKSVWKVTAVTKDAVDQIADYATFTMTITGTKGATSVKYSTSGGKSGFKYPWAANGTLTFDTVNPATTLTRDDTPAVIVTYAATATQLTMSFNYSGPGFTATRSQVVTGQWVFTFSH
jgi:hypothetical protein